MIAVIAAGERWPDGALHPAVEDLWGAGAVIAALTRLGATELSPEAQSASAAFASIEAHLESALLDCSSGRELVAIDFTGDVTIAAELDSSQSVPVLANGCFTDASKVPRRR